MECKIIRPAQCVLFLQGVHKHSTGGFGACPPGRPKTVELAESSSVSERLLNGRND